jgi:hypothetical protein
VSLLGTLPVGLLLLLGARVSVPDRALTPARRLDLAGVVTASLTLGATLLAVGQAPSWGWTSYSVLGLASLAALSLALFAVVELSVPEPMLDLRALTSVPGLLRLVLLGVPAAVLAAGFFDVPVLLEAGTSLSTVDAALGLLLPMALTAAGMAGAVIVRDRFGPARVVATGLLVAACGTYLLHGAPPSDAIRLMASSSLRSLGLGLAVSPLLAAAAGPLAPGGEEPTGRGAALAGLLLVAGTLGAAVVGSAVAVPSWYPTSAASAETAQGRLLLLHGDLGLPLPGGTFLHVVLLSAGLCAVGAVVALRLPDGRRSAGCVREVGEADGTVGGVAA